MISLSYRLIRWKLQGLQRTQFHTDSDPFAWRWLYGFHVELNKACEFESLLIVLHAINLKYPTCDTYDLQFMLVIFLFYAPPLLWKQLMYPAYSAEFCKARYLSRTLWYRLPLAWRRWRWRSWGGNCHLSAFGGSFDEVIYLCTGAGGRFFSSFEAGSESAFSWVDQWVQWLVKWSRAAVVRTSTPGWVVTRSHRISPIFVVSPVSQSTCKGQVFDGRG